MAASSGFHTTLFVRRFHSQTPKPVFNGSRGREFSDSTALDTTGRMNADLLFFVRDIGYGRHGFPAHRNVPMSEIFHQRSGGVSTMDLEARVSHRAM
jgi:hypothetical protein